jgi:hypothetical protein
MLGIAGASVLMNLRAPSRQLCGKIASGSRTNRGRSSFAYASAKERGVGRKIDI